MNCGWLHTVSSRGVSLATDPMLKALDVKSVVVVVDRMSLPCQFVDVESKLENKRGVPLAAGKASVDARAGMTPGFARVHSLMRNGPQ